MPGGETTRRRSRPRLQRGTLSRDGIVRAAIELLDSEGPDGLTFTKLGARLEASPTAVYRHFRSRDELVFAIADALEGETLADFTPSEHWTDTLRDLAWRAWRMAETHPAAAAISLAGRPSRGDNELKAVNAILEALAQAGWRGDDAVIRYRAFANAVLALAATQGSEIVADRAAARSWLQEYPSADPARFPHAYELRAELLHVDEREVFEMQVELLVAALQHEAPGARGDEAQR